jgi:hypothetical protein
MNNLTFSFFTAALLLCGTSLAMAASEFQVICNPDIKAASIAVLKPHEILNDNRPPKPAPGLPAVAEI